MIDLDKFMESCKPYQKIIDDVTLDECICVAISIPIGCNHEEMIIRAIIQRLLKEEKIRAEAIDEYKMALLKAFDETNINEYGFYPQNVVDMVAGQLKEQKNG